MHSIVPGGIKLFHRCAAAMSRGDNLDHPAFAWERVHDPQYGSRPVESKGRSRRPNFKLTHYSPPRSGAARELRMSNFAQRRIRQRRRVPDLPLNSGGSRSNDQIPFDSLDRDGASRDRSFRVRASHLDRPSFRRGPPRDAVTSMKSAFEQWVLAKIANREGAASPRHSRPCDRLPGVPCSSDEIPGDCERSTKQSVASRIWLEFDSTQSPAR
jgi:hypothetical protein